MPVCRVAQLVEVRRANHGAALLTMCAGSMFGIGAATRPVSGTGWSPVGARYGWELQSRARSTINGGPAVLVTYVKLEIVSIIGK